MARTGRPSRTIREIVEFRRDVDASKAAGMSEVAAFNRAAEIHGPKYGMGRSRGACQYRYRQGQKCAEIGAALRDVPRQIAAAAEAARNLHRIFHGPRRVLDFLITRRL